MLFVFVVKMISIFSYIYIYIYYWENVILQHPTFNILLIYGPMSLSRFTPFCCGIKVWLVVCVYSGVFISRGKEDALVTKNMVVGESVYGEKRISVEVRFYFIAGWWTELLQTTILHYRHNALLTLWQNYRLQRCWTCDNMEVGLKFGIHLFVSFF